MRIWLVGGGTAGHTVPLLALAAELENHQINLITDRRSIIDPPAGVQISRLSSGKFRRYHGRKWWQNLLDLPTHLLNFRDIILVLFGFIQSFWLMRRLRPDVVFLNGGAVGLPISLACRLQGVPYLIHESDVVMGLSNRLAASGADLILFGLNPGESVLSGLKTNSEVVGIQLRPEFNSPPTQDEAKQALGVKSGEKVVLVTGGSQGAQRLNHIVYVVAENLTQLAVVFHIVGPGHGDEASQINQALSSDLQPNYRVSEYEPHRMMILMAAADIVITRAGATTLSELAHLGVPTIIVPNPQLTGAHQTRNAKLFAESDAAIVLSEAELKKSPQMLSRQIEQLLSNKAELNKLSTNIKQFDQPSAAERIIELIKAVGLSKRGKP